MFKDCGDCEDYKAMELVLNMSEWHIELLTHTS